MAHRLLVPPVRRMEGVARLPLIQDPGRAGSRQLLASMRTRDSLRLLKTTGRNIAPGPLPQMQSFVMAGPGYPNTPESMQNGRRFDNAPRVAGKTTGADVGFGPTGLGGSASATNNASGGR